MATSTPAAEQAALSNILKSPTQGGAAVSGGTLGAGADVPKVLAQDPATAQLLQESVYTQTGQKDKAVAASQTYTGAAPKPAPSVVTSTAADTRNATNQNTLNNLQTGIAAGNTTGTTGTTGTTTKPTGTPTTGDQAVDPLQTKIDNATSQIDAETAQATALLDARMSSLSATSQAQIANIKAVFEARRAETTRLNQVLLQSNTKAGIRAGRNRYAPEINQGVLTDVEQQGLARISQLDSEEMSLINEAQAASDTNQFNLLSSKLELAQAARKEKEAAISALNKDAMAAEQFALEKAKAARELQKYERDDASGTIDAMVTAGVDASTLPADYFAKLDTQAGYAAGTSQGLFDFGLNEKAIAATNDAAELQDMQIKQAQAMNNLLMDLPVGQTVTIGGVDYSSRNKGETSVFTEYNGQGDMNVISYNQDTGDYKTTTIKGVAPEDGWDFVENNGVGMFINANTQETRVAYDTSQPDSGNNAGAGILAAFPVGSTGGQCGSFVRKLSGYTGPSITAISAKEKLVTDFGFEVNEAGVPQGTIKPGMSFIMNDVGDYGHIGMVNSSTRLPDGSYSLDITDSNWGGNEKVQHRTINSKDVYGFADLGLQDQYRSGTDAPTLDESAAVNRFGSAPSTTTDVKATEGQRTVSGYASRTVQAESAISELEDDILALGTTKLLAQRALPTALKSESMQLYEQAESNFINAVLRRESGAAISPEEFKSQRLQYFPQPGEPASVVEQKRKNRELVQRDLISQSGSAYTAPTSEYLYNDSANTSSQPQQTPSQPLSNFFNSFFSK